MTDAEVAERSRRAVAAAVAAAGELGLRSEDPVVLHDVFSVVVHLAPHPVVARVPLVLTGDLDPARQAARQQRELDVVAWLHEQGVPVVPPSDLVPRMPVRRDGFPMTFWELAELADDHEPYRGVDISWSALLHARLADYPGELPFLAPFNHGLPAMLEALDRVDLVTAADVSRARSEFRALRTVLADEAAFASAFPGVGVQPVQGDAPSHNVIRTTSGIRFSDFEDVTRGPVEWDLAMMGAEAVAAYDDAAVRHGLRRTDAEVQRLMDAARRLQLIGCLTLIPQLPLLADGLAGVLEEWRASAPLT
ncbi:phosphotransferase [Mycobacterium sp. PS03-16]|nr:phosphotransferase [Mycobacterium sp. PS03-16]